MRGGRVNLHSILNPPSEFDHAEKGDALYGKLKNYFLLYNLGKRFLISLQCKEVTDQISYVSSHGAGIIIREANK